MYSIRTCGSYFVEGFGFVLYEIMFVCESYGVCGNYLRSIFGFWQI